MEVRISPLTWFFYSNLLKRINMVIDDFSSSVDNTDLNGKPLHHEKFVINTGTRVVSVAFGTGISERSLLHSQQCNRKYFDPRKELLLATGHENGRIRIWDLCASKN